MPVELRRAYDADDPREGTRYLVDRLWPRGRTKEVLHLTAWLREIAPSAELFRSYAHRSGKFTEFRDRYRRELAANPAALPLIERVRRGETVTLVFGARDVEHSNAAVLKEFLEEQAVAPGAGSPPDSGTGAIRARQRRRPVA